MKPSFETLIEQLDRSEDSLLAPWAAYQLVTGHEDRLKEVLRKLLGLAAQKPWILEQLSQELVTLEIEEPIAGHRQHLEALIEKADTGAQFAALKWLGSWEGTAARDTLEAVLDQPIPKDEEKAHTALLRRSGAVAGLLAIGDDEATKRALKSVEENAKLDGREIVDWPIALIRAGTPDAAIAAAARLFRQLESPEAAQAQSKILASQSGVSGAWSVFQDVLASQSGRVFRQLVKANLPGVFEDDVLEEIGEDVDKGELGRSAATVLETLRSAPLPEPKAERAKDLALAIRCARAFLEESLEWGRAAGAVRRELVPLLLAWRCELRAASEPEPDWASMSFDDVFMRLRAPKIDTGEMSEALLNRARSFSPEETSKLGEFLAGNPDLGIAEGRLWRLFGATRQRPALEQVLAAIRADADGVHSVWFSALGEFGAEALPELQSLVLDESLSHPARLLAFLVLEDQASEQELENFVFDHFVSLQGHLTDELYRFLSHSPSERYLPSIMEAYRPGEAELAWAGLIHCELFRVEPAFEKRLRKGIQSNYRKKAERMQDVQQNPMNYFGEVSLRLRCTECQHAYLYDVGLILVDVNRLEAREGAVRDFVHIQSRVKCKYCKAIDRYEITWSAEEHLRSLLTQCFSLLPRLKTPKIGAFYFAILTSEYMPGERPSFQQLTEKLKELSESRPGDAPLLMNFANQLRADLQYDEALKVIDRLVELEPEAAEPYILRGTIHQRFDRHQEAYDDFQKGVERIESGKQLREPMDRLAASLGRHLSDSAASIGQAISGSTLSHLQELATRKSSIVLADDIPQELTAEISGSGASEISQNALCPCGSGRKFKACHGQ
ncbi:MAG: SEC-C domain-containing protein [Planctomycetota bacterium]